MKLGSHDKHHRSCNGGLSLSDLPVEIIWQIASYLATPTITCLLKPITVRQRKYDLCSVRLVCRDLKLKVQEPFMRAAFGELEVDMVPEALQKLIEISEDPEVSSVVKTLYFLADQGGGDLDHEAWYEDNMERIYMENGAGAALITRALEGFSHLKCVKIQPVQWWSGSWRFFNSTWPHGEGSTTAQASSVMAAIGISNIKLERLIFTDHWSAYNATQEQIGYYINNLHVPVSHLSAFSCLRVLDLLIAIRPSKKFKWEMIDSFSRFVSLPRKTLTSLSIRFDSSQRTNPMLAVLEELEYDKLEHFQLEVAYLMEEEAGILCTLEKFLTRHTNIESIRLAYIELHGREWRDILEILIQYPNLKVLELENLTQEDESVSFDGAKQICLRHNSDMPQAIISAMHQLDTQGGNDMDIEPTHRYYKYTDDSEPDYDEE